MTFQKKSIFTSRALRVAAKSAVESMGRGPGVVTSIMANVLKYNQELVKQLSEVRMNFFSKQKVKIILRNLKKKMTLTEIFDRKS